MAFIVKAPESLPSDIESRLPSVFLAGSIDMGAAVNWQEQIERALDPHNVIIFNPRRDDWDSTWEQSIDNPQFFEQVSWELSRLEEASLIVFYFDPNGKAPITLLELGLFCHDMADVVVCCPEGYWRKGNVDVVCHRYGITQVSTLDDLIEFTNDWAVERTKK